MADTASVTNAGKHAYLHKDQGNEQKLYKRAKINIGKIKFCSLFLLSTYLLNINQMLYKQNVAHHVPEHRSSVAYSSMLPESRPNSC